MVQCFSATFPHQLLEECRLEQHAYTFRHIFGCRFCTQQELVSVPQDLRSDAQHDKRGIANWRKVQTELVG